MSGACSVDPNSKKEQTTLPGDEEHKARLQESQLPESGSKH